jgi:hypothetical protein
MRLLAQRSIGKIDFPDFNERLVRPLVQQMNEDLARDSPMPGLGEVFRNVVSQIHAKEITAEEERLRMLLRPSAAMFEKSGQGWRSSRKSYLRLFGWFFPALMASMNRRSSAIWIGSSSSSRARTPTSSPN